MIEKYQNEKLSLFLKKMLKEYDSTCYLFYLVYKKIFNTLKLTNFYGLPFIGLLVNKEKSKTKSNSDSKPKKVSKKKVTK